MANPKINFLIEWNATFEPKNSNVALSRTLDNIDKKVFQDVSFTTSLWKSVARSIGKIVNKKFELQGPGWSPLHPVYLDWKRKAKAGRKKVKVGSFGKRLVKFTEIGRLTGTLRKSAVTMNKDANIFKVENVPGWAGGAFKYAIDLNKLPYAKKVNDRNEFFFVTENEAQRIMEKAYNKVWSRMSALLEKGAIVR